MRLKFFLLVTILIITNFPNNVKAADFNIPSLSRCLSDMSASNTKDPKIYNIFSDFYYEFEDKRDYAAMAVTKMVEQFSASHSNCQAFTQPMNRETIKCDNFSGSDVCRVPSDAGEFIVIKDYVDSTNIILTEYSNDYQALPTLKPANDLQTLWLPKPELCYSDLLEGLWDSQSYAIDTSDYTNFGDLRYVMARSSRDLVKSISQSSSTCSYQTQAHEASKMQCFVRNNKPSICSIASTGAGYFVYVTDKNNTVHAVFNRWD
jgi:hypothetical protein